MEKERERGKKGKDLKGKRHRRFKREGRGERKGLEERKGRENTLRRAQRGYEREKKGAR